MASVADAGVGVTVNFSGTLKLHIRGCAFAGSSCVLECVGIVSL